MELEDLLAELQSLKTDENSVVTSGNRSPVQAPSEEPDGPPRIAQDTDRPPDSSRDKEIPRIKNIYSTVNYDPSYDSLEPPPKPPRNNQPGKTGSQNGSMSDKKGESKSAKNVSELDALLDVLGKSVPKQTANVSQGVVPKASPQVAVEMSLDDMLEELQMMDKKKEGGADKPHPPASPSKDPPSTAHKLDALLVELSTFKPPPKPEPSPTLPPQVQIDGALGHEYASVSKEDTKKETKPQKPVPTKEIDSMLAELDVGVKAHGVDTAQKGCCAACCKPIHGRLLTAMNRTWHPEHFVCTVCKEDLAHQAFYEYEGRPYCEMDYNEMLAPRCNYCNGPILERCINAMGKAWHPEHFFCSLCGKNFEEEGLNFYEKDGKAYCKEDYFDKFAPTCKRCSKAIMAGYLTAIGSYWHSDCFNCKTCNQTFPKMNFFEHEGQPYCELHYHAVRGSLCANCKRPITKDCVSAMGKKYHPEHFSCTFCKQQLKLGNFKEHKNNAYCSHCYTKLFG